METFVTIVLMVILFLAIVFVLIVGFGVAANWCDAGVILPDLVCSILA
jgi:hypothetical protein